MLASCLFSPTLKLCLHQSSLPSQSRRQNQSSRPTPQKVRELHLAAIRDTHSYIIMHTHRLQSCHMGTICFGHSFNLSPLHPSPPDPCAVVDCAPGYRCEVYVPTLEAVCAPYCELENGGCPLNQRCQLKQVQCSRNPCPPAVECLDMEGEDRW